MLFETSYKFDFRLGKYIPVNWTNFDISCHLWLPPCELVQVEIHAVGGSSDLMWVSTTGYQARGSTHRDS